MSEQARQKCKICGALRTTGGWADAEKDALKFAEGCDIKPSDRELILIAALEWFSLQWGSPVAKTALQQFKNHKELEE